MKKRDVISKILDTICEVLPNLERSPTDPYDLIETLSADISLVISVDTATIGEAHDPTIGFSFCLKKVNEIRSQLGLIDESKKDYAETIIIQPWVNKTSYFQYHWVSGEPTDFIGLREEFSKRYVGYFEPIIKKYTTLEMSEEGLMNNVEDISIDFYSKLITMPVLAYLNRRANLMDILEYNIKISEGLYQQKLLMMKDLFLNDLPR